MLRERSSFQQTPPMTSASKLSLPLPSSPTPAALPPDKENINDSREPLDRDVRMDTAKGLTLLPDIRMATARGPVIPRGDIHMETVKGTMTVRQSGGLQLWERELLNSPEVKRKATVAQLCV